MLRIYTGSDYASKRSKMDSDLRTIRSKRTNAEYFSLEADTLDTRTLEQYISSLGLFDDKSIVVIHGALSLSDTKQRIYDMLPSLIESSNMFMITDEQQPKATLTKLKNAGAEVFNYDLPADKTNPFVLTDHLFAKNKQALLLSLYDQLAVSDIEPLVGILVSGLKQLSLAKTRSLAESGLKPYSYNKAKNASWSASEATDHYRSLLIEYHLSRRGGLPLLERIERFILAL